MSMIGKDISSEVWREYDFKYNLLGLQRVYRIWGPTILYVGTTTHRVLDYNGIVHCVPAPGECGCVLRWRTFDDTDPVQF